MKVSARNPLLLLLLAGGGSRRTLAHPGCTASRSTARCPRRLVSLQLRAGQSELEPPGARERGLCPTRLQRKGTP